ncbi:hypothetical protein WJX81_005834 [Elliptochloris bilobata]|uniref:Uncharacterized protein n=1 Tax=Elliptochloris bilobata TaxID=381761 RepID=A0AAW1RVX6_9CHLO
MAERTPARERELKQKFQWTMVCLTAATGGAYALQGVKERFGFEQRLINCAIAFWVVLCIRYIMTCIWRFGVPPAAPATPAPGLRLPAERAASEDTEEEPPRRRSTRTRRET